jgi:hypothetical protein
MKMFIPIIGDKIELTKTIKVELKNLSQNTTFLKKYDELFSKVKQINKKTHNIELKKGTILTIDRVYIRKGSSAEYNSITFRIANDKNLPNGRFFLPISVVNTFEINKIDTIKKNELKLYEKVDIEYKKDKSLEHLNIINEIKKKSVYNFDININIMKVLDLYINETEGFTRKYLNMDLREVYPRAIEKLKITTQNLSKETSTNAKNSIEMLESWGELLIELRKKCMKKDTGILFNSELFKIEDEDLKSTHLMKIVANKDLDHELNFFRVLVRNYTWMIQLLLEEVELEDAFIIRELFNGEINYNLESFLDSKRNIILRILSRNDSWRNIMFADEEISYIEYDLLNKCKIFNKGSVYSINNFVEFKDEEGIKNISQIRSSLTKHKKKV